MDYSFLDNIGLKEEDIKYLDEYKNKLNEESLNEMPLQESENIIEKKPALVDKDSLMQSLNDSFHEYFPQSVISKIYGVKPKEPEILSVLDQDVKVSEADSDKMESVKREVIRYQRVKGTIMEAPVLYELIQACNRYTSFKFSFLKFGRASKRLKEVQAIRDEAWRQWKKAAAKINNSSPEEKKKIRAKIKDTAFNHNGLFAPEIKHYYFKELPNEAERLERMQDLRVRMALIKKTYPGISSKDAETVAVYSLKNKVKMKYINASWMDAAVSELTGNEKLVAARRAKDPKFIAMKKEEQEEDKREKEIIRLQEEEEERKKHAEEERKKQENERKRQEHKEILNDKLDRAKDEILAQHNVISRFFLRNIFGGVYLENKAFEWLKLNNYYELPHINMTDRVDFENGIISNERKDTDLESIFI